MYATLLQNSFDKLRLLQLPHSLFILFSFLVTRMRPPPNILIIHSSVKTYQSDSIPRNHDSTYWHLFRVIKKLINANVLIPRSLKVPRISTRNFSSDNAHSNGPFGSPRNDNHRFTSKPSQNKLVCIVPKYLLTYVPFNVLKEKGNKTFYAANGKNCLHAVRYIMLLYFKHLLFYSSRFPISLLYATYNMYMYIEYFVRAPPFIKARLNEHINIAVPQFICKASKVNVAIRHEKIMKNYWNAIFQVLSCFFRI